MANINDFKIINARSINKFKQAAKELSGEHLISELDETKQARLGFYFLTLEAITGISDFKILDECIIDSEYNKLIHEEIDDLGIDAVYIDQNDGNHIINLFTYKFRVKFSPDKTQEEDALLKSTKFLSYIQAMEINKDVKNIEKKVQDFIVDIIKKLQSTTPWEINLYNISNENNAFPKRLDPIIRNFQNNLGLSIKSITLDDITGFFSEKKRDKVCKFVVSKNDILSYKIDEQETDCSYVIRINLIDVIRMCCNDDNLANQYSLENDDLIKETSLERALLFDNIRGYLGDTNYNKNIKQTIIDEPQNFFMFNNGLTITTSILDVKSFNSDTKMQFKLQDYQLVNGGQTINTIFKYLNEIDDKEKISKLRKASVLMRIFKVSDEIDEMPSNNQKLQQDKGLLKNRIAEYTNSQNSINPQDLKSVSSLQIKIQQYLEQFNIQYIRKAGKESKEKIFDKNISMEQLAKILYSCNGHPERVTNQKRKLFTDYYDEIFKIDENGFDFSDTLNKVNEYLDLRNKFKDYTEQKIYYIMYIIHNYDIKANKASKLLENTLVSITSKNKDLSPARALIQKTFKDELDEKLVNSTKKAVTV